MLKRTLVLFAVAALLLGLSSHALAVSPNMMADHTKWSRPGSSFEWARPYLEDAMAWDLFTGYPRGSVEGDVSVVFQGTRKDVPRAVMALNVTPEFRPENRITRAEFAAILARVTGFQEDHSPGDTAPFRDMPAGAWYGSYVVPLYKRNVVRLTDRPGDEFQANAPITRVEIAAWVARAADAFGVRASPSPLTFTDTDEIAAYWRQDVAKAISLGIINGYPDGSFRPNHPANRAEAAKMVVQLVKHLSKHPPGVDELKRTLQDAADVFYLYLREHPEAVPDLAEMHRVLSPYYPSWSLKWWVMDPVTPETCPSPDPQYQPKFNPHDGLLCGDPYGWELGFFSLPQSYAWVRQRPLNGYAVLVYTSVEPEVITDRFTRVRIQALSQGMPADGNRETTQYEYKATVWMLREGGRWKVALPGRWEILRWGIFDRSIRTWLDDKNLSDYAP